MPCEFPKDRNFKSDNRAGKLAENKVLQVLEELGIHGNLNPASDHASRLKFDIAAQWFDLTFTGEVKYDLMEAKTGNVAIEYYNIKTGAKSGLLATESDLWFHVVQPLEVYVCNVADLLAYFTNEKPYRSIECGGDDNSAMKLYRRDVIFPAIFHRFDGQSAADTLGVLAELLGEPFVGFYKGGNAHVAI